MRIGALVACVIVVLTVMPPRAGAQASRVKSDQDILIELEHNWDAAFRRHDAAFIATILADEFVVTYDDGSRGDRARELELAVTFNQTAESATMDEFIVKEFGNTAVVWFTLHLVGPSRGQTLEVDYRYTDVFVLRDGRWQCVSSQSTRVVKRP